MYVEDEHFLNNLKIALKKIIGLYKGAVLVLSIHLKIKEVEEVVNVKKKLLGKKVIEYVANSTVIDMVMTANGSGSTWVKL